MNATQFDTLTRSLATRLSRRNFLGFVGVGAVAVLPIAGGARGANAQQRSDAANLVLSFYENVDAYQYKDAYALLGSKWHGEQSEDTFIKGYHNTAFVQCAITGQQKSGNSAVVDVELISWHNDGKIVAYDGSYTVGQEGGKLTILAGNATTTSVPSDTPPLCMTDDLSFAIGGWDPAAGNRYGYLTATNTSASECALGGVPRVTLTDRSGDTLVSVSSPGAAPEPIVLGTNDKAQAQVRFANWCGDTGDPESLIIEVPGDLTGTGSIDAHAEDISYPPCLGETEPALLELQGWTAIDS